MPDTVARTDQSRRGHFLHDDDDNDAPVSEPSVQENEEDQRRVEEPADIVTEDPEISSVINFVRA